MANVIYNCGEPLKSFRFSVSVPDETGAAEMAVKFGYFSGITMKVETMPGHSAAKPHNTMDYVPGLVEFNNVVLAGGVVSDSKFFSWIEAVASTDAAKAPNMIKIRRDVTVKALDDQGQPAVTWVLKNAMPVGYTLSPFDGSKSAKVSESIELAIEGFTRDITAKETPTA